MPQLAVKLTGAPGYPAWYVPTAGKLARKSGDKGGGSWVIPAALKVKDSGVWKDSGYVGYPGTPSTPWVTAWDYANVSVSWGAPTSGAPVTAYHVEVRNEAGTGILGWNPAANPQGFGVSQQTRYQVVVRARGATGLFSAWSAPLRIAIGRPQIISYHNEQRTEAWSSGTYSYDIYRNQWGGFNPPDLADDLHVTNMGHYGQVNAAYFCDNSVSVGRWIDVYYAGAGGYGGSAYRHANVLQPTVLENLYMDGWTPCWLGFHALDVGGWSYQVGGVHMWGNFNFQGTHYYTVSVQDVTPAIGNSYW